MEIQKNMLQIRFTAYVTTAVRNKRVNYLMQKSRHSWVNMEQVDQLESLHINFEELYHRYTVERTAFLLENWRHYAEFLEMVEDRKLARALKHLKERDRMILFARLFGEESFSEIGETLQMSSKQAEMSYYYVLRKLRKELEADKNGF
ncbi:MAG: sigma-70 family RNA polymerase sigma factor [Lachnospiraceae bacterium]|nr:sigma-70 family RNA polymerase sigma factor [Lachnospiraceae bacterium]MBR1852833.1 sigma-70 family RNA polymerase sigma factor [Lachnospiraceae bacterium]